MDDLAAEFFECCSYNRVYVDDGLISKQVAVDNCQLLAEEGGYIELLGVDFVQAMMSEAFAPAVEMPSDYASQLVMQWELADPRDCWRWTGELPPKPQPQPEWPAQRPYRTPEATVDAVRFVVSRGDPEEIAAWLRNHLDDAPALLETLEAA